MASIYQRGQLCTNCQSKRKKNPKVKLCAKCDSRIWWILFYEDGEKIQRPIVINGRKVRDRKLAQFHKNETENRLATGESPLLNKNILLSEAYRKFKEHNKVTVRPATQKYYRQTLDPFIKYLPANIALKKVNDSRVIDYLNTKKIAEGMTWHIIKSINTLMRFCVKQNMLPKNPVTLKKPRVPKRPPESWTPEEIKKVLRAIDHPKAYSMVYLNIYFGLRPAELLRLKWQDIDFKSGTLTVPEAKDGEFRKINIHPDAVTYLKKMDRKEDFVFGKTSDKWMRTQAKNIREKAGMQHIKRFWYSTRHTFATNYYNQTGDLRGLQEILGHSKIEMTTVYVNPNEEQRRKNLEKLDFGL